MSGRPSRKTTREPTDSAPPVLEMSKPSMARGRAARPRAAFSSSSGSASPACLRRKASALRPARSTSLRAFPPRGMRTRTSAQPRRAWRPVVLAGGDGQEEAGRQLAGPVEGGQEAPRTSASGDGGRGVDERGGRIPDLALAHEEDVDGGSAARAGEADDVLVFEGRGDRAGPVPVVLDRPQEVAQAGRLFESLLRGRPLHPRLEGPGQLGCPAFEKKAGVLDVFTIGGLGDEADARRRAELELVFEAGPLAAAEDGLLTAADEKVLVDEVDGGPGPAGRAVGAEIARAVGLDLAAEIDPRPGLRPR